MYSDGYSLNDYGAMIRDERRFLPYLEALRRYVTPESVVLDIGAGPGILSFIAIQCGARRVFAVEPDPSIEVAKLCAADIPGSERITFIQDLSTKITLPEQADLVVGDLHGSLPFYTGNISALADARKRHLKPGGRMMPQRDLVYLAPATSVEEYASISRPWRDNDLGLPLAAAADLLVNTLWRARSEPIAPEQFLSPPQLWGSVDYRETEAEHMDAKLEWQIERAGTLHGYYLWFDGEIADGLSFSNSPLLPTLVYGRNFLPIKTPVVVEVGDAIRARFAVKRVQETFIYRWDTTIDGADGQQKASFRQTTFTLHPGARAKLAKSDAAYIPRLTEEGQIERFILQQMDAPQTLAHIVEELRKAFPKSFKSKTEALSRVAKLSQRYG